MVSYVFTLSRIVLDVVKDAQTFVSIFVKQTLDILCDPNTPFFLFYQIDHGLQRLLLSNMAPSIELTHLQKLFGNKFIDDQRCLCLNLLQLTFLICIKSKYLRKLLEI